MTSLSDLSRRGRFAALALSALALGACGGDSVAPASSAPAELTVVSGAGQTAAPASTLSEALVVSVTTADGAAVQGATVAFAVSSGDATVNPATATTDVGGLARTTVTLGAATGAVQVRATVAGTALSATIAETAVASASAAVPCTAASAQSLALGQVVTSAAGGSLCLAGGAAAQEYTVVAFNGSTNAAARGTLTLAGSGLGTPSAAAYVAGGSLGAFGATGGASGDVARMRSEAFDLKLRATEARVLTSKIGAARQARTRTRAAGGPSLSVIPTSVTVGQLLSLNANGDDACTNAKPRAGRVVAVTSRAIVVADTSNPAGGFTDAEYASYGGAFDQIVDPMIRQNFGAPSDIDGNGKVLLFFTSAVNAMTPRSANYYVGGFFFARDLFPPTAASAADACAGSNDGEMFYLMVPDPTGTINGNKFSKSMVTTATTGIVAHEYQHLVNASRRLYVNGANDFEDTWLDEGLAHVAEELLFYAESGLAPRANLDAAAIRASQTRVDAFNSYAIANFDRFGSFLANPAANSPYADNDSLATRGAAWAFLRYAADQKGAEPWSALENSTATGFGTLALGFGSELPALFRDFAVSLAADDVAGVSPRWQQPSWGFRSVFAVLGGYPLAAPTLLDGASSTVRVAAGGAAYLRVAVPANGRGTVAWGALPAGMGVAVVRTK